MDLDNGSAENAVQIGGLNAYYGKSQIIHDLSMRIPRGKISVVVGRNGMGKSTLVKSVMNSGGVTRRGSIRLFDVEIGTKAAYEVALSGVAYVPQGRRLFPSLSVEEHLLLALSVSRGTERRHWTLRTVFDLFPELEERRKVGGSRLSGGEQQMLAVARALLLEPQLLIMDEPSEGLSKMVIKRVEETCRHVSEAGMTVLLVEQNLEMALNVADHSFVLVNGHITYDQNGDQFREDRVKIAGFLGV